MIGVGLIGFGFAGRYFHAPLVESAGMRIAAVVTRREEEVRAALPGARVLASTGELDALADIDLIVIATPNQLHAGQAVEGLMAGRHVVIDKPMALIVDEADRLIALAEARRRVLSVFHNRRWDSDFLTLCDVIATGRLGEVHAAHFRWDRFRPQVKDRWRERGEPGSGVLYDLGSHLIDQALYLFGPPDWVQADVFTQRPGAAADDGFEILMAKGSLRVSVGASSLCADGGWRYRVHGAAGSFLKAGLDVQEEQLLHGVDPLDAGFGVEPASRWGKFVGADGTSEAVPSRTGCWLEFYRSIRRSVESGTPPPVPAAHAREVLRVLEAASRSSREGRRMELR